MFIAESLKRYCGRIVSGPTEPGRASQTEDVYERLRTALLSGHYPPGHKLKISELCGEVQGSLGAVREALSRLLAEGLVHSEPYKGFHVSPVSPADLIDLTRTRIEVEKLCLASSLAHGDIAWEGRLVALLHELSRSSGRETAEAMGEWSRLHTVFHDTLVSACDSSWLLRLHRILHEQSERYRRLGLMVGAGLNDPSPQWPRRDTASEHKHLVEAAIARDVGRLSDLIATHIQRTTDDLLRRLQAGVDAE
jgi:GntR family carbon starvation induced transcriptional regulator